MARLSSQHKAFIMQRIACFVAPVEIQSALKEQFSIDVPLSTILYYDPDSTGTNLGAKVRKHIARLRDAYLRDTAGIPGAHRKVRVRELWELYLIDKRRGATTLAAQHLAQIAKEMGDFYTNRRVLLPGDPADELANLLGVGKDELLAAVGGGADSTRWQSSVMSRRQS